jgi:hypothetical protein
MGVLLVAISLVPVSWCPSVSRLYPCMTGTGVGMGITGYPSWLCLSTMQVYRSVVTCMQGSVVPMVYLTSRAGHTPVYPGTLTYSWKIESIDTAGTLVTRLFPYLACGPPISGYHGECLSCLWVLVTYPRWGCRYISLLST